MFGYRGQSRNQVVLLCYCSDQSEDNSVFFRVFWHFKKGTSSKTFLNERKKATAQNLFEKLRRGFPVSSSSQKAFNQIQNGLNTLKLFLGTGKVVSFHPFGIRVCLCRISNSFFLLYLLNSIIFNILFIGAADYCILFFNILLIMTGESTSKYFQPSKDDYEEIMFDGMGSKLLRIFHVENIAHYFQ